jgi:arylsulfatase A-like enzyme
MDFVETGPDQNVPTRVGAFLDAKPASKPFFLWVNFSDPHHPWDAKADEPKPESLKLPAHWPDLPGLRKDVAAYMGEVNRVDRKFQAVLDEFAKRGFDKNTLFMFMGDNGQALPHGKGSLYDPGLNVPLLVRWIGQVQGGGESRELISGEDIGPTFLEAAGVAKGDKMSGVSFLKALRGQPHEPRKYIFGERGPHGSAPVTREIKSAPYDLARCVRSDKYKFIYNCTPWVTYAPVDSAGDAGWREMVAADKDGKLAEGVHQTYFGQRPVYELYDLEADPSELKNRVGDPALAEVERSLRDALAEKMILDFDYLPLPDTGPAKRGKK